MNYSDIQIVLQEIPGEISICFTITGCKLHCEGCHSPYLWKEGSGEKLLNEKYLKTLKKYKGFASCVLFMGGEWHQQELVENLRSAKEMGYKTGLYTGLDSIDKEILEELTWLKTGAWIQKQGGLDRETTNQKFIEVKTKTILNHLFIKK
ncbi:anaerobic ribonucleoside-triphosphate reductase activating protein [Lutibacter sp.]